MSSSARSAAADEATLPAAAQYQWHLPRGFPPPLVPADNPMSEAKVELGRRLFSDKLLSVNGTTACATCHIPEHAFTDGRARALGATGQLHARSAMSLTNVAYNASFTWEDPRFATLEAQMRQPMFNEHPVEMGLKGREFATLAALRADASYAAAFAAAFPGERHPVTMDNVIRAIASYERTLISGPSAFDRYVFDDERTALSESARRGMALFYSGRIGCGGCHFGINFSGPIVHAAAPRATPLLANTGLYNVDGRGRYPDTDRGLEQITHRRGDNGKFRVPTLRNIARTAPYMHDGSIATLGEVIDHYAAGGRQAPAGPGAKNEYKDKRITGFDVSAQDKADLVAFLDSLSDAPQAVPASLSP